MATKSIQKKPTKKLKPTKKKKPVPKQKSADKIPTPQEAIKALRLMTTIVATYTQATKEGDVPSDPTCEKIIKGLVNFEDKYLESRKWTDRKKRHTYTGKIMINSLWKRFYPCIKEFNRARKRQDEYRSPIQHPFKKLITLENTEIKTAKRILENYGLEDSFDQYQGLLMDVKVTLMFHLNLEMFKKDSDLEEIHKTILKSYSKITPPNEKDEGTWIKGPKDIAIKLSAKICGYAESTGWNVVKDTGIPLYWFLPFGKPLETEFLAEFFIKYILGLPGVTAKKVRQLILEWKLSQN